MGIGTAAPTSKVTVYDTVGGANYTQIGGIGASSLGGVGFGSSLSTTNYSLAGDGARTLINAGSTTIGFRINNVDKVTIDAGGNLGIGTTGPTQLLHVAGNMRLTGTFYDVNNEVGVTGQVLTTTGTGELDGSGFAYHSVEYG